MIRTPLSQVISVASKELREIRRDSATMILLGGIVAVLVISCVVYFFNWKSPFEKQVQRNQQAREAWLSQQTDSPHQATHTGTTIYKTPSPVRSIDPGLSPLLGTVVQLESHQRHEPQRSLGEDEVDFLQLEFTSPALLIQALMPLAVLLISHSIISKERELGTELLLSSFRLSPRLLYCGKLTALFSVSLLLSIPLLIASLLPAYVLTSESGMSMSEYLGRVVLLYALSLLYLSAWNITAVAVSSRCSSSTTLILLLTLWMAWTIVLPKMAVDIANSLYTLPHQHSLQVSRETAIRQGTDGQVTLEQFNLELEERLLKQYGVSRIEDVPVNLNAARLLAMEEFTNSIDENTKAHIDRIHQQQNEFLGWFEFLSPYLALRAVSSTLAGTDRYHHDDFLNSAESYRRQLVKTMNTAEINDERPGETPELAREFWAKVPEYRYQYPAVLSVISRVRWQILLLFMWITVALIFALRPPQGVRT